MSATPPGTTPQVRALTADGVAAFAVFARHRNLTRAAEELHIAQPSLHSKLAKLSRALGSPLYERVGRELVLTADGEALAAYAADQQQAADDFAARLDQPRKQLRIAAGRAALQWVLDEPLRQLVEAGFDLRITPGDRATALSSVETGLADVAAIAHDPPPAHLLSTRISSVPQMLVVTSPHPLADRPSVAVADLDGLALVLPPPGRPHRQSLERALAAAEVEWHLASEADGWDFIIHLTKLGLGATVVNGCVPVAPPLVKIPVRDLPEVGYWLAWRQQRQVIVDPLLGRLDADG